MTQRGRLCFHPAYEPPSNPPPPPLQMAGPAGASLYLGLSTALLSWGQRDLRELWDVGVFRPQAGTSSCCSRGRSAAPLGRHSWHFFFFFEWALALLLLSLLFFFLVILDLKLVLLQQVDCSVCVSSLVHEESCRSKWILRQNFHFTFSLCFKLTAHRHQCELTGEVYIFSF